jgi:hypothetical protein
MLSQYDPGEGYDADHHSAGELLFLAPAAVPADTRFFDVYGNHAGSAGARRLSAVIVATG